MLYFDCSQWIRRRNLSLRGNGYYNLNCWFFIYHFVWRNFYRIQRIKELFTLTYCKYIFHLVKTPWLLTDPYTTDGQEAQPRQSPNKDLRSAWLIRMILLGSLPGESNISIPPAKVNISKWSRMKNTPEVFKNNWLKNRIIWNPKYHTTHASILALTIDETNSSICVAGYNWPDVMKYKRRVIYWTSGCEWTIP